MGRCRRSLSEINASLREQTATSQTAAGSQTAVPSHLNFATGKVKGKRKQPISGPGGRAPPPPPAHALTLGVGKCREARRGAGILGVPVASPEWRSAVTLDGRPRSPRGRVQAARAEDPGAQLAPRRLSASRGSPPARLRRGHPWASPRLRERLKGGSKVQRTKRGLPSAGPWYVCNAL